MIFQTLVGGKTLSIEQLGEKTFRVGEKTFEVDCRRLESGGLGVYSLLIDGRSYEVSVRSQKGGFQVEVGGHLIPVTLVDPSQKVPAKSEEGEGPAVISSPMPGRVVGIKVGCGDSVSAGEGVVVVEAMKMENELAAPRAGRVKRIAVKVGDAVEAGQELIEIG